MRTAIMALLCLLVVGSGLRASGPAKPAASPALVPLRVKDLIVVNDTPAVLLVDDAEQRYLLIYVDAFMDESIRTGLYGPPAERPLTHDLLVSLVQRLGGRFTRVAITALKDNTYYALVSVQIKATGAVEDFDARPSDAIAIAVRTDVPIFAARALLRPMDEGGPAPAEPTPHREAPPRGQA